MGKRSRKRESAGGAVARRPAPPRTPTPAAPAPHARPLGRKARMAEAPPAPWSPFPLVELSILAGLIMIVLALAVAGSGARLPLLAGGFVLIAISAVELAIREHFGGFRSHTTLLAGATVLFPIVPLSVLAPVPRVALLTGGVVVFALAFFALRAAFARRAGGMAFRA